MRRLTLDLAGSIHPYLVHLEDDEEVVTSAFCDISWTQLDSLSSLEVEAQVPTGLSRPRLYRQFLGAAAAVTVITPDLRDLVPDGVPSPVLEPGVERFEPPSPDARAAVRRRLGLGSGTQAVIHHGSIHPVSQRDAFSLYAALRQLRAEGVDIVLLRAGVPAYVNRRSTAFERAEGVRELGYLPKKQLFEVLGASDICVNQEGLRPPIFEGCPRSCRSS